MFGKYSRYINHAGERFGRWTALRQVEPYKRGHLYWLCRCECGTEREVSLFHLVGGKTRSCGCLQNELMGNRARTHGMSHTRTYMRWWDMLRRCNDPRTEGFKKYGARGIKVCERWQSFENFFADMGHPPKGMSIERIDNNGDYCPENCKWATTGEQASNTRRNRFLTFNGETMTVMQWARRTGMRDRTITSRLRYGWSVTDALSKPLRTA